MSVCISPTFPWHFPNISRHWSLQSSIDFGENSVDYLSPSIHLSFLYLSIYLSFLGGYTPGAEASSVSVVAQAPFALPFFSSVPSPVRTPWGQRGDPWLSMWEGSTNGGSPIAEWFIMDNPSKMDDLGLPPF